MNTIASGTGIEGGAAVLFEQKLARSHFYFGCRYHIFALIIKAVWNKVMGYDPSPESKFCSNLHDASPNIDTKVKISTLIISGEAKEEATNFFKDILDKKCPAQISSSSFQSFPVLRENRENQDGGTPEKSTSTRKFCSLYLFIKQQSYCCSIGTEFLTRCTPRSLFCHQDPNDEGAGFNLWQQGYRFIDALQNDCRSSYLTSKDLWNVEKGRSFLFQFYSVFHGGVNHICS